MRIAGTDGLLLQITPTGTRSWHVYATQGKGKTAKKVWRKIGSASAIPVQRAIDLANVLVQSITTTLPGDGLPESFDALFQDHFEQFRKKERRSWQTDVALFNRHIRAAIGATPLNQLDKRAVVTALNQTESKSTRSQARLAHSLIGATFKWGVGVGRCLKNPTLGIPRRNALEHRERKLSEAELRTIWHGSARFGRQQQIIVQLLLVLAGRRSEVVGMERGELEKTGIFLRSARSVIRSGASEESQTRMCCRYHPLLSR